MYSFNVFRKNSRTNLAVTESAKGVPQLGHHLVKHQLAAALAELARPGDLILLAGDLGAGKTAFTQGFGAALGIDLDDAYDKAIRLNPELFDAVQSGRQAEVDAAKRAAANTAAKRARAAAVSVKGSTPGTVTNTKAQDRRSLLAEQFDNISDRL